MKKLLLTPVLILAAVLAQAADTNLSIRVTATVVGVSTNQTTVNWDASIAKEKIKIDGGIWMWNRAKPGETNTLDFYLAKTFINDAFKAAADAKNRSESAVTLQKLTTLLTTDLDLLTAGDLSSLATIANKAP